MRAIGYREFFVAEDSASGMAKAPAISSGAGLAAIAEKIKLHTRRYAKRQMTFFRRLPVRMDRCRPREIRFSRFRHSHGAAPGIVLDSIRIDYEAELNPEQYEA